MIAPLRAESVDMRFEPTLSNEQYRVLSSEAPRSAKVAVLLKAARRARRGRVHDGLVLIHRLLFLARMPGVDPPAHLDVYDFDDALFLGSISAQNRGGAMLKQEARRWAAYVARARLVTAGNSYLADEALKVRSHRVEVLPTCVEPSKFTPVHHEEREVVTVGWVGSRTTAPYLHPVLDAVARLHESGRKIKLLLIGASDLGSHPWLEQRRWSLDSEVDDLAGIDIGVMPMPDTRWARGKCGYKLLQYFAAGVPAIVSPVGVATQMVGDGRGLLARSEVDWERAILQLAGDPNARQEMAAASRVYVEKNFSYARWAPELAGMLKEL